MTFAATRDDIASAVVSGARVVRVVVAEADGSVPREAGAAMLVSETGLSGTIGGGALEFEAIHRARRLLGEPAQSWRRELWTMPLGPALGQCCGGRVILLAEVFSAAEFACLTTGEGAGPGLVVRPVTSGQPAVVVARRKVDGPWPLRAGRVIADMLSGARATAPMLVRTGRDGPAWFVEPFSDENTPLVIFGAGHVGRALVRVLDGLPFAVTWVDTTADRFPAEGTPGVARIATSDLAAHAASVAGGAFHLVLTFSHAIDLAICHALLKRGDFAYLGLIGSATKRARFERRLGELGVPPRGTARLVCPIGLAELSGKQPGVIAVSVVADLLRRRTAASEAAGEDVGSRIA